jgi:acyl-CoA synthetase (AMP-forming)/AMP-acid ligase II
MARTFEVDDTLRTIQDEHCTVILGVPTLYQMWLNSPVFPEVDLSHVRFFISGGAPCPRPVDGRSLAGAKASRLPAGLRPDRSRASTASP